MEKQSMTPDKLVSVLTANAKVTNDAAQQIASCFTWRSLELNEYLVKNGRLSDEYFFLEQGYMRAFALDKNGDEITTGFYQPGAFVFEVASFFSRTPSKENIQAVTVCEGWCISFSGLNELFHNMPEFREFGRSVLVKGYAELKTKMLNVITETAEQRYVHLLNNMPAIFQHLALKQIASLLGITDTSLSRIRKSYSLKS